jgi:hypothetical protein
VTAAKAAVSSGRGWLGARSAASSPFMKASASLKRAAGSLASARITTASRAGGTFGLMVLGRRGVSFTCFRATATALSPSNGTLPVSAS